MIFSTQYSFYQLLQLSHLCLLHLEVQSNIGQDLVFQIQGNLLSNSFSQFGSHLAHINCIMFPLLMLRLIQLAFLLQISRRFSY